MRPLVVLWDGCLQANAESLVSLRFTRGAGTLVTFAEEDIARPLEEGNPLPTIPDLTSICRNHYANGLVLRKHAKGKQGHLHGACYTAGYAVEAILKAAICKVTGVIDYDDLIKNANGTINSNRRKRYYIHQPMELLFRLAAVDALNRFNQTVNYGLYQPTSPVFEWDADKRYNPAWRDSVTEANRFLESVAELVDIVDEELHR